MQRPIHSSAEGAARLSVGPSGLKIMTRDFTYPALTGGAIT